MLTIVISSFDGYSDLWSCFFSVFQRQWPNCPYEIKLISNYKNCIGVDTINVGEETYWTDRTLKAVRQIDSEYILLLLEDYLIGEPVKTEEIENALAFMRKEKCKYLRLTNIPRSRFNDNKKYFPLYADEEYAVNLQASIWKKNYLIESLEKYAGNAWEFEIGFLRMSMDAEHKILDRCFGMAEDPLHIHNGVLKGKWFPKEIRYFSKKGFTIKWRDRGKLNLKQSIKYTISVELKNRISYNARKKIKVVLKKLGMKFVSDL